MYFVRKQYLKLDVRIPGIVKKLHLCLGIKYV